MENPNLPNSDSQKRSDLNEQPPILGTWNRIYAVVLGVLVVEILLFVLLGQVF